MRTTNGVMLMIGAGCVMAAFASAPALAQNALGDGRVLDANPGQGTGGRNARVAAPDFRLRNLLVTGDVAAGRGFRQSVGYRAPSDFRGDLGSNDLFPFLADSARFALPFSQVGRSARPIALGQDFGMMEFRRQFTGTSASDLNRWRQRNEAEYLEYVDAELRLDALLREQYSWTGLLESRPRDETLATYITSEGQLMRVVASPIRGVRQTTLQSDFSAVGLSMFDYARVIEDQIGGLARQLGRPFEPDLALYRVNAGQVEGTMLKSAINRSVTEEYDALMRKMAQGLVDAGPAAAPSGAIGERLGSQLTGLSEWLYGKTTEGGNRQPAGPLTATTPATLPIQVPNLPWQTTPGAGELPELPQSPDRTDTPRRDDDERPVRRLRPIPLGLPRDLDLALLRHDKELTTLTPAQGDRFAQLVAEGQAKLAAEDYFAAESFFIRALRMQPNHPLAMAGLANGQLGAQVFASAALSIRNLFIRHPEMIDVRYAEGIRPSDAELRGDVDTLRARLESGRRSSGSALLIAFIGRQLGDRAMIEDGLDRMGVFDALDPLPPALRVIWLNEDPPEIEPNEPEAPELLPNK